MLSVLSRRMKWAGRDIHLVRQICRRAIGIDKETGYSRDSRTPMGLNSVKRA
jgi:hypothetical protein